MERVGLDSMDWMEEHSDWSEGKAEKSKPGAERSRLTAERLGCGEGTGTEVESGL